MWTAKPPKDRPTTALSALDLSLPECLPNVTRLPRRVALPVTAAEPERFSSRTSLVATAIRTTVTEERLEAIRVLKPTGTFT